MTLQQLHYFLVAGRCQNISKAAEKLGKSQSSISYAIKNLEKEFGVELIKCGQVGFTLTKEGELLTQLASSLVDHTTGVLRVMQEISQKKNSLHLGICSMLIDSFSSGILSDFMATHPSIDVFTKSASGGSLLKELNNDLLDIILIPFAEISKSMYTIIPLKNLETVCLVSTDNPLAKKKHLTAADLSGKPLALPVSWYDIHQQIKDFLMQNGAAFFPAHQTNNMPTIISLVQNNIAIGFSYLGKATETKGVAKIPLEPAQYSKICLVFKNNAIIKDSMQLFIDYIKSQIEHL